MNNYIFSTVYFYNDDNRITYYYLSQDDENQEIIIDNNNNVFYKIINSVTYKNASNNLVTVYYSNTKNAYFINLEDENEDNIIHTIDVQTNEITVWYTGGQKTFKIEEILSYGFYDNIKNKYRKISNENTLMPFNGFNIHQNNHYIYNNWPRLNSSIEMDLIHTKIQNSEKDYIVLNPDNWVHDNNLSYYNYVQKISNLENIFLKDINTKGNVKNIHLIVSPKDIYIKQSTNSQETVVYSKNISPLNQYVKLENIQELSENEVFEELSENEEKVYLTKQKNGYQKNNEPYDYTTKYYKAKITNFSEDDQLDLSESSLHYGVTTTKNKSEKIIENRQLYNQCNIRMIDYSINDGYIIFACDNKPSEELQVQILILRDRIPNYIFS